MRITGLILLLLIACMPCIRAQQTPYTGGNGSGYQSAAASLTACTLFWGSSAGGAATSLSAQTVCPQFFGARGDGYASDSSGCVLVLPVKLLVFDGQAAALQNVLHWKVEDGYAVKEFEVERSVDGISFKKIAVIAANANSHFNYLFTDSKLTANINFYRLRLLELDGAVSYSNIIVLKTDGTLPVTVYPNPAKNSVTVYCYSNREMVTRLSIYDTDGRLVLQRNLKLSTGVNHIELDIRVLATGLYILRFEGRGTVEKMVLKKD